MSVNESRSTDFRRAIPSVDEVLMHPTLERGRQEHPRFPWTPFVRAILDELRSGEAADLPESPDRGALTEWVARTVSTRLQELRRGGLRRVLNGTGVVLHTNLGRAVVGEGAVEAVARAMRGYVTLEVDLASGERGPRAETLNRLLACLTGAEAAMVVNNNAAAVYLVANTFSPPGRVIVSRGELVEIGGSFRLPEILRHSAAEVVEVGTTNRTYADDYRKAARAGDLLLKVHKSNYAIQGFAHEATAAELVKVARDGGCHVVYDLGSGAVYDFAASGVGEDPVVSRVLADGVDAVTMSADKLLGSVQAGIVAGARTFVGKLRQNPLRRAFRVDKVTVAALQEVARSYLFAPDPKSELPVLAQVLGSRAEVRRRAERVAAAVAGAAGGGLHADVTAVDDDAAVGGGSLSAVTVPSAAVVVRCHNDKDAVRLARALRMHRLPVFARVRGNEVRVNMTTILPSEDDDLARAIGEVVSSLRASTHR